MTSEANDCWVVYSPNESATSDSAGFWSNEFGWVQFDQATHFSLEEALDAELPVSVGRDARFVTWQDARQGSVAKIVKLEHAWRRLDGRNDDGFQVAPFPG
ncbi:hypothetical protein PP479_16625 [Pseudomonas aeruginosa]|uniref:hypothetical protein n=1 Tax=Pseudomonas aeruginosa TaxID=287 RepID=UPI002B25DDAC|nr:hypothetical protein [Pseudomonas aeruginosa]WOX91942.1 hypothetical protein PP479_16625 [Pseudomonas aeruginosa]